MIFTRNNPGTTKEGGSSGRGLGSGGHSGNSLYINLVLGREGLHCSARLSPVKFEWKVQPFLPWEPLF